MSSPAATTQPRSWRRRLGALLVFGGLMLGVSILKGFQQGWFEPRLPLALDSKPALVFFTLSRGCECQMVVVEAAEAQLAYWTAPQDSGVGLLRVDFERRPDLARQYGVVRAPALVLLDAAGQVVWKQDLGLSDEAPLDLEAAEGQIRKMGARAP